MSDEQRAAMHRELQAVAAALGKSPTMQEFANHAESSFAPQHIVKAHGKGGWNAAKQAAGLSVPTVKSDAELAVALRALHDRLGRLPTSKEINADRDTPSASLYIHRFGSLPKAFQNAGIAAAQPEKQSDADVVQLGVQLARRLDRLPGWNDWVAARAEDPGMPSEWQIYRRFGGGKDAWRLFHYLIFEAAHDSGIRLAGEYDEQ
jgi:Homing endonuclease associated repeat